MSEYENMSASAMPDEPLESAMPFPEPAAEGLPPEEAVAAETGAAPAEQTADRPPDGVSNEPAAEPMPESAQLKQKLERTEQVLRQYRLAEELRTLQAHDPQAKLTDLSALGEDFYRLRCAGVSAIAAYEATKYQRAHAAIPPDPGAIGTDRMQEKDYYSPEEVDRLSDRELDDPKIMERVMRSMTKWKK